MSESTKMNLIHLILTLKLLIKCKQAGLHTQNLELVHLNFSVLRDGNSSAYALPVLTTYMHHAYREQKSLTALDARKPKAKPNESVKTKFKREI